MYPLRSLQSPFIINFEVTNQCNLECVFCCAQLSKYRRKDLSKEKILEIIAKIASEDVYSIFLTGGEPFMRDDLPQFVKECLDYGMNVSLSTNGTKATKRISRMIASTGLDEIQVSIHAPNNTNDEIVGVSGAVEQSFKGLQNLIDAGLRATVASVATLMNYYLMPELVKKVAGMGARYFRILRLMPHSSGLLQQVVPYKEMQTLIKQLVLLEEETEDFMISIHTSPGFLDRQFYDSKEYKILHPLCHTCTAGKTSMSILSDGDCTPCSELKSPEFICGNILHDPLSDIWNSKPMSLLRSAIPDNYHGRCGNCEFKWVCYSARCVAYNLGGDILGDDESCYFFLEGENNGD
jgi:radical SAM protein with 4Fe4S-binding SPASM domain